MEQKTRLRLRATSTIESDGLRSGNNPGWRYGNNSRQTGHMTSKVEVDPTRDDVKLVHFQAPFDLGEKPCQQLEVAAGHPDQPGHDLWREGLIGQRDADRRPALFEQFLHFARVERAELVKKTLFVSRTAANGLCAFRCQACL
jgi:hypothetical protein